MNKSGRKTHIIETDVKKIERKEEGLKRDRVGEKTGFFTFLKNLTKGNNNGKK